MSEPATAVAAPPRGCCGICFERGRLVRLNQYNQKGHCAAHPPETIESYERRHSLKKPMEVPSRMPPAQPYTGSVPSSAVVLRAVCTEYGIKEEELKQNLRGRDGLRHLHEPKRVAIYLLRYDARLHRKETLSFFGLSYYGSIADSINKVRNHLRVDSRLQSKIEAIRARYAQAPE